jgi:hypothetical protein
MQLKVIKTDGGIEEYLHTKIIGTISNALADSGHESMFVAEQLAEAITFYLYNNNSGGAVGSGDIYSMIQAMLSTTGYDDAALALNNYHYTRELMRRRIEVVNSNGLKCWNKSQIVHDLGRREGMQRQTVRTIASMVEEKVLRIGLSRVPTSLIRELVEIESHAILDAEQQLDGLRINSRKRTVAPTIRTDACLERERKGLCRVAV